MWQPAWLVTWINDDDGPLVSRPIFELSESVGPFFEPLSNQSPPKRHIEN